MNHMNNTSRNRIAGARQRTAIVTAAGLVILAACGSSPSSDATSNPSSAATTTAREPGYAAELRPVLQDLVTSMQLPSAVVVVRSSTFGDATFEFGTRELGSDDPPTTTDHYRIGSLTKTMTATVILQLAQEGKLSLDDPISKYQPDVPNGDNITIANLLDMRSGLSGYDLDPVFLRAVDKEPERIWSPDDVLEIGYSKPALFAPGKAYDYSNTNYILLGLVMEHVTGKTASELFEERLFDPLDLEDTTLPTLDDASIPSVYAHGYQFTSAEKGASPDPSPDPRTAAAPRQAASSCPPTGARPTRRGAGPPDRSISTADDVVVWAKAVVDGELLNPEMQARRHGLVPSNGSHPARRPRLRLRHAARRQLLRPCRPHLRLQHPVPARPPDRHHDRRAHRPDPGTRRTTARQPS